LFTLVCFISFVAQKSEKNLKNFSENGPKTKKARIAQQGGFLRAVAMRAG
jgi:hypothetical protein